MVSQKEIANALGITQAAVSRALRGDRGISTELRQKVRDTAESMGYHLNEHVSALMSNIRTRKKLTDKGGIGLLIEARNQKDWYAVETFRRFHQGVLQRGEELGFNIESFFLLEPNMRDARIDQILQARGIDGIILAPPGLGKKPPDLQWERYATVVASKGWDTHDQNRVSCYQLQNYITAFNKLLQLGYTRIGTALDNSFVQKFQNRAKWHTGYLECQHNLLKKDRIPVFTYDALPRQMAAYEKESQTLYAGFCKWFSKWQPEVIITLLGAEIKWLNKMGQDVPQDVGLVCLAQQSSSDTARIDEKPEALGAAALELVAGQIARNEFGFPPDPKTTLIEGCWVPGSTVLKKNA